MIVAGLRPCSFVDHPGRLSAVVFTQGCNLRCRYCHNPELVAGAPARRVDEAEVLSLLARRRGRVDAVVLTGGEPTLQPDLLPFVARARALGYRVKLDTNGTRPEVVAALLEERLLDYVAIDLKSAPAEAGWLCGAPGQADGARRCLELALGAGVEHELRTTVVSPVHTRAHLEALTAWAAGAERWWLQRFRPGGELDAGAGLLPPPAELLADVVAEAARRGLRAAVR